MKARELVIPAVVALIVALAYDLSTGPLPEQRAEAAAGPLLAPAAVPGDREALDALQMSADSLEERLAQLDRRVGSLESSASRQPVVDVDSLTLDELQKMLEELGRAGDAGAFLDGLVDSGELERIQARYREKVKKYWEDRVPEPPAELVEEGRAKLSEAVDIVYEALEEAAGDPEKTRELLDERLADVSFENAGQITILDGDGNYVHHRDGLTGSSNTYKDVSGKSPYEQLLLQKSGSGSTSYYDFTRGDAAREMLVNYQVINELGWYVLTEGSSWKKME